MSKMFLSELNKDQDISMVLNNGVEMDYKIIEIFADGLKVLRANGNHIMLVPFTSIKYIRVK